MISVVRMKETLDFAISSKVVTRGSVFLEFGSL